MKGIDYASGRPGGKAIKEAGYDFVCRYLSNSSWKNIDNKEINDFRDNNIALVLVWESTADAAQQGYDHGSNEAKRARELARTIGFPDTRPIYFAVDFEVTTDTESLVKDYFNGIKSVENNYGVYGGLKTVQLIDSNYKWQTLAWSHGVWASDVSIKQLHIDSNYINNVVVDINEAVVDDFGQWNINENQ